MRTIALIFLITQKGRTEWCEFSNVKSSKMLSFHSVTEAHGLIYPRPSGKHFSFVCQLTRHRTWLFEIIDVRVKIELILY